jgi:transcription antitermination factor NusG
VEITNGPHKGKIGAILMIDKERGILKVDLGLQSNEWDDNYFEEFAIRRLRK